MHVLVEEVGGDPVQLVGLQVEVLQLAEVVERSLADFLNLIIIQRQPE